MRLFIILILFLVAVTSCFTRRENKALEARRKFMTLMDKGDTLKAVKVLDTYSQSDTADVETALFIIKVKVKLKIFTVQQGLSALRRLHMQHRSHQELKYEYLMSLLSAKETEANLAEISKLSRDFSKDFEVQYQKGRYLLAMGKYEQAEACFDRAIKINPENKLPRSGKLLIQYKKGNVQMACEGWSKPGGTNTDYYESYCRWPKVLEVWEEFKNNPNHQTAELALAALPTRATVEDYPDSITLAKIIGIWRSVNQRSGNKDLLRLALKLSSVTDSIQGKDVNIEIGRWIVDQPKVFLEELGRQRSHFDELDVTLCTVADGQKRLEEIGKRIIALSSITRQQELIKIRGQCLLALETRRNKMLGIQM